MKLITINVEDEEHTAIKLAATKAGLSIKDYLLRPQVKPSLYNSFNNPNFDDNGNSKLCKHGKPATFCKFAKPGKPCK